MIDFATLYLDAANTAVRLVEDDILFTLLDKIALDATQNSGSKYSSSYYKNYLAGWTDFNKLKEAVEAALKVIKSTELENNVLAGDTHDRLILTNYFYYFICIVHVHYDGGNSAHSYDTSILGLGGSLWDSDKRILYMSRADYENAVEKGIANYRFKLKSGDFTVSTNSVDPDRYEELTLYENAQSRILYYVNQIKEVIDKHPKV